ncbi:MAG: hypothetical protein WA823_07980, partial [Candidatus Acidiferrales bacterium]
MYINTLRRQHAFTNEKGEPLPRGTIIMLDPFPQHCGFLDYNEWGEQILLHKSKTEGPIISGPERFIDGPTDLTGVFCTSRGEREFTRRTAGNAQQEVQSRTDS